MICAEETCTRQVKPANTLAFFTRADVEAVRHGYCSVECETNQLQRKPRGGKTK